MNIRRGKLVTFCFVTVFLISILFGASIQMVHGTKFENAKALHSVAIDYTDSKNGSQHSQRNNQTITEGVELVGNVTYVVDGDTLDINGTRVRLSLVDTPERGQPGFKEAKEFVSSLCLGKNGELDVDDGQRRGDRFGRELGVVYCNGVNVNEKLMDKHLAKILSEYCDISEFSMDSWAKAYCLKPK